jgi:(S)-2-hydroxy-acid oxidase
VFTVAKSEPLHELLNRYSLQIDVLPEIVKAVKGRVELYLDGGVRMGTDVLKAIGLGAKAVFLGRPIVWGLSYKGYEGVSRVLKIMKEEFDLALALAGMFWGINNK